MIFACPDHEKRKYLHNSTVLKRNPHMKERFVRLSQPFLKPQPLLHYNILLTLPSPNSLRA